MLKRSLRAAQLLKEARDWADDITLAEMRDPGESLEAIWRRVEAKYGIPYGTMWSLRWRFNSLKDIAGSLYFMLHDVHALIDHRRSARAAHQQHINELTGRSGT